VTSFDRRTFPVGGAGVVPVTGVATVVGGLPVAAAASSVSSSADDVLRPGRTRSTVDAGRPTAMRVDVRDQALAGAVGVHGVVLTLSRSDRVAAVGRVRLSVDYGQFANGFGASFGSRLRLVSLPDCALNTPQRRECQRQTLLRSVNSESTTTVTADVTVAGDPTAAGTMSGTATGSVTDSTIVALTSSSSAVNGDFTATSLSPAYGWAAGDQGGSFTYRYPLKVPASLGGPTPQLDVRYDSGVTDGQSTAQNGQASWVGEGWNLEPGYIERSYRPCGMDGNQTGDLCWYSAQTANGSWSPAMTMVFNGKSTRLLRDNTTAVWHAADDSGLRVEQLTGVANGPGDNGSYNREYWKVTTLDGTQYFFGMFHRYAGDPATTWGELNAQVVGNNPGEPCNGADYFHSGCLQGYRWNLDYVVDPRGNSMTYFYTRWGGAYGFDNNQAGQLYDMSSTLEHIEYGTRAGSEGTQTAPMKVTFGTTRRCIGACGQNTTDYPDTPFDQYCAPGTPNCPNLTSQVFWTPFKLSTVTTQVSTGSGYRSVDKWDLAQTFPSSGDRITPAGNDTSPNLWLQTITHTGYAADGTTSLAEPTVSACRHSSPVALRSRVSGGEEYTGEARRAATQLAENGAANQAPEPVARDVTEERAKPPAIQAEVHDPRSGIDEVRLPNQLDLQAHVHPRARRVVLLAGIHAALQPLGRPAERRQHPGGQACALGHVRVAAGGVEAGVVQPAGAQEQFAVEPPVAGEPLGNRELAQAVPLHRAVRARRRAQRLQGRPGGRRGGQRVGVHGGESSPQVSEVWG
jgi:hypothetical protein